MDLKVLLHQAKAERLLTQSELDFVRTSLLEGRSVYRCLCILGLAKDRPSEALVRGFLEERDDPMVAGRALRVLANDFDLYDEYYDIIMESLRAQPSSQDSIIDLEYKDDMRLAALHVVSRNFDHLKSKEILEAVLSISNDTRLSDTDRLATLPYILLSLGRDRSYIFIEMSDPDMNNLMSCAKEAGEALR